MGSMLDSDWSRNFLLRCDWLGLLVASITTQNLRDYKSTWPFLEYIFYEKAHFENIFSSVVNSLRIFDPLST